MELKRGFFLLHKKLRRSTFFTTYRQHNWNNWQKIETFSNI